eukprot:Anaeramoba_ignava/c16884_g2_i1.p2 GENE.c16884_g2_i1~~c16884_g2_i1.p2  ORF type:complete len:120 (+),score=1.52 c16884_g2_i1:545-904(+)
MKWLAGVMVLCSSLLSDVIAISAEGNNLSSPISSNASRSDYYIFVNEKGELLEIKANPFKDTQGGASFKLTQMLKSKGVSRFVASRIGGKLENSLISNEISFTIKKGEVDGFIQELKKR